MLNNTCIYIYNAQVVLSWRLILSKSWNSKLINDRKVIWLEIFEIQNPKKNIEEFESLTIKIVVVGSFFLSPSLFCNPLYDTDYVNCAIYRDNDTIVLRDFFF